MSDVAHETSQEFWQPPAPLVGEEIVDRPVPPMMAEVCPRCSTEFLPGSRFCHTCGARRPEGLSATATADAADMAGLWVRAVGWTESAIREFPVRAYHRVKFPLWLRYLHFHEIQRWIGLSTAAMIAFVVGLCCVVGGLAEGLNTTKTLADWQAIQFYRVEWLLAATAAFVAGILLKKPSHRDGE
jgi:hypothetical protein